MILDIEKTLVELLAKSKEDLTEDEVQYIKAASPLAVAPIKVVYPVSSYEKIDFMYETHPSTNNKWFFDYRRGNYICRYCQANISMYVAYNNAGAMLFCQACGTSLLPRKMSSVVHLHDSTEESVFNKFQDGNIRSAINSCDIALDESSTLAKALADFHNGEPTMYMSELWLEDCEHKHQFEQLIPRVNDPYKIKEE